MLGKEAEAVERDVEWRFMDWSCQRGTQALLDRCVGGSYKVQRKVQAIGADPRRLSVLLECRTQLGRDAPNLFARRVINVDCEK